MLIFQDFEISASSHKISFHTETQENNGQSKQVYHGRFSKNFKI